VITDEVVSLGIGELAYVEVLPGSSREALQALESIHLENFGDKYPKAINDFSRTWSGVSESEGMIAHQWLLHLDGEPCGELVFEVNLPRRMVNRHFTSVQASFRPSMPAGWIPVATQAVADLCNADARRHGVELLGMMSEILPRHAPGWRKLGLFTPDIEYSMPLHQNYWEDFPPLEFVPMVANILPFAAGREAGIGTVAEAGVKAFLLEYYKVPEDDQTFLAIVDRCRALAPAW